MVRTVHLTDFSILQTCLICTHHTQQNRHKQMMTANSGLFFSLNTLQKSLQYRKHSGDWAIWWQLQESWKGKECLGQARRPCNYKPYLSPRVLVTPSASLPGAGGWRGSYSAFPGWYAHKHCSRERITILVCSVFSPFEVRHFKTVVSLVPQVVRLTETETFTVKRWLQRQTTENVSMKLKLFSKFLYSPNWSLWNLGKSG